MQGIKPDVIMLDSLSQVEELRKDIVNTLMNTYGGVAPQLPPIKIPAAVTEVHKSQGMTATELLQQMRGSNARNIGDALLEAFSTGHGLSEVCFDNVEKLVMRNMRGSSKSMWPAMFAFAEADKYTVKHDLKQLQDAQTSNGPGKDPLFEAMDKHNQLIKLGRKAIHEMFHARPLNLNQKTPGPYKSKDWE